MVARLLKEARGLLPAWLAAVCLVLAPLTALRLRPLPHQFFLAAALGFLLHLGLALGPLMLSSVAFGREFDRGTFGLLLSQPVSRWRLWWEKTGVLALALALLWGIQLLAAGGTVLPVRVFAGIVLAAYGGGLLCSLLVRQTLGAVCLGAVVPALLFVISSVVTAIRDPLIDSRPAVDMAARLWVWASGAWALAAYVVALLLFFTREDAAPSQALAVFGFRLRPARRPGRRVSPWRALVWKELHLQQWSLYLGLALPLLTLIAVALAPFGTQRGARVAGDLAMAGVVFLALIVPALIGLTTVAEERRTGTLAWQRTLPAPHWMQFGLKLGVAYGLGLLCTPWVPLVLGDRWDKLAGVVIAVTVIVLLTVFASSLASHVVEALVLSFGGVAALLVTGVGRLVYLLQEERWGPLLASFVAMASVVIVLAGWNAREVAVSRRRLWATVAGVVVAAMVASIGSIIGAGRWISWS